MSTSDVIAELERTLTKRSMDQPVVNQIPVPKPRLNFAPVRPVPKPRTILPKKVIPKHRTIVGSTRPIAKPRPDKVKRLREHEDIPFKWLCVAFILPSLILSNLPLNHATEPSFFDQASLHKLHSKVTSHLLSDFGSLNLVSSLNELLKSTEISMVTSDHFESRFDLHFSSKLEKLINVSCGMLRRLVMGSMRHDLHDSRLLKLAHRERHAVTELLETENKTELIPNDVISYWFTRAVASKRNAVELVKHSERKAVISLDLVLKLQELPTEGIISSMSKLYKSGVWRRWRSLIISGSSRDADKGKVETVDMAEPFSLEQGGNTKGIFVIFGMVATLVVVTPAVLLLHFSVDTPGR